MNKIKKHIIVTAALSVMLFSLSCATNWYKNQFDVMKDKTFEFSKVLIVVDDTVSTWDYGSLDYENTFVFQEALKKLPIAEIAQNIERIYGIKVDYSKFQTAREENDFVKYNGEYLWQTKSLKKEVAVKVASKDKKAKTQYKIKRIPKNYIALTIHLKTYVWASFLFYNTVPEARKFPYFVSTIDFSYKLDIVTAEEKGKYSAGQKGSLVYNYPGVLNSPKKPTPDRLFIPRDSKKKKENVAAIQQHFNEKIFNAYLLKWLSTEKTIADAPKKEKSKSVKKIVKNKKNKKNKNKKKK